MSANADQPAHPVPWHEGQPATGLTKRELLAAMAMQGLNACRQRSETSRELAAIAVEDADALLAELAKPRAEIQG